LTTALYPGSFDPITFGHLDIINRASQLFDKLVVGVFNKPSNKHLLFSTEERVQLAEQAVAHMDNVSVVSYSILTVHFAQEIGAEVMVRGLRMTSDFEREFGMAMMNRKLARDVELVCFMASLRYQFLSSSLMREVAELHGSLEDMVPDHVAVALVKKFGDKTG
jgi:pantetheine-phosphate adenylyltransferase